MPEHQGVVAWSGFTHLRRNYEKSESTGAGSRDGGPSQHAERVPQLLRICWKEESWRHFA